ncbi:MAG: hypothetical protein LBR53_12660 [Deltaproteobacteria bacterium]|jgi:hypothetical protein|nr:hypothetical protein [Deltaproteobacteria bacterium]
MTSPKSKISLQFEAATKHFIQEKGKGTVSAIARGLGLDPTDAYRKLYGLRPVTEDVRRKVAEYFGYDYDSYLAAGAAVLEGRAVPQGGLPLLGEEELRERGFVAAPFSAHARLSPNRNGFFIPRADELATSKVVARADGLGKSSRDLQAFLVDGDAMEPVIAKGGIVVADLRDNNLAKLKKKAVYVLRRDSRTKIREVKYLSWAKKPHLLAVESEKRDEYPPVYREPKEVRVIGRVILAWREF